jgi:hypothetical protein
LAKLVNRVGEIDFQEATAVKYAFIVVLDSKNAKSFLLAIPVATDALEASCAVVEGMGQDADFGFREWHKLFVEKGIIRHVSPFYYR